MAKRWFASSRPERNGGAEMRLAIVLAATLLLPPIAWAEPPAPPRPVVIPSIPIEPAFQFASPVLVGDLIGFQLKPAPEREGAQVRAPEDLKALSKEGWTLAGMEGGEYKLIPLKAGELKTPRLDVVDESGKKIGETEAKAISIVSSLEADDLGKNELQRLRPPVGLPVPWFAVAILAGLLVVLVALIIWALVRWSKKRRSTLPHIPASPPLPEDALALRELAELEGMNWPSHGEFKRHYFRVSEILKRYLGARYSFEAAESTTEELFDRLKEFRTSGMNDAVLDCLDSLFSKLDRVKFTDHRPPEAEAREVLETARQLISKTKRVVVAPTAPAIQAQGESRAV